MSITVIKTFKVQCVYAHDNDGNQWMDIPGEDYVVQQHAEQRKSDYWEKLPLADWTEFRVVEGEFTAT